MRKWINEEINSTIQNKSRDIIIYSYISMDINNKIKSVTERRYHSKIHLFPYVVDIIFFTS